MSDEQRIPLYGIWKGSELVIYSYDNGGAIPVASQTVAEFAQAQQALDVANEHLAALEAWTATATETMLDSAAALATAADHEQAARLLSCVNARPDREAGV